MLEVRDDFNLWGGCGRVLIYFYFVGFSLVGVVLIARPEFLFGRAAYVSPPPLAGVDGIVPDSSEKGTPAQRLGAVGFVSSLSHLPLRNPDAILFAICRVALFGVLGTTGACKSFSVFFIRLCLWSVWN